MLLTLSLACAVLGTSLGFGAILAGSPTLPAWLAVVLGVALVGFHLTRLLLG